VEEDASETPLDGIIASKEAAAISTLDSSSTLRTPPRRMRRRRRSVRRRLFDSVLPFAILIGLTLFAVGMVRIVELGAAGQSRPSSATRSETAGRTPKSSFNYELAQAEYEALMRQHAGGRIQNPKLQNQVSYQLSLQIDAQRDLSLAQGLSSSAASNDVMDWTLFERSSVRTRAAKKTEAGAPPSSPSER